VLTLGYHRRSVFLVLCLLVIAALQRLSLSAKIQTIEPEAFALGFVELKATSDWRFGYVGLGGLAARVAELRWRSGS
jgi:hypothetical protein